MGLWNLQVTALFLFTFTQHPNVSGIGFVLWDRTVSQCNDGMKPSLGQTHYFPSQRLAFHWTCDSASLHFHKTWFTFTFCLVTPHLLCCHSASAQNRKLCLFGFFDTVLMSSYCKRHKFESKAFSYFHSLAKTQRVSWCNHHWLKTMIMVST